MRMAHLSAVLLIAASASGCAVGPRYRAPKAAVPATWNASAQGVTPSQPAVGWWTQFKDPVLDSLVERAVSRNLDLQIARARIREARAARGISAAADWPEVNAGASYERLRRSEAVPPFRSASPNTTGGIGLFGDREQNLYQVGFDSSWELDVFGGVRRDVEAARAEIGAAEENLRDVLVTLLAEVARNYVELQGLQREIVIANENLRIQQETLELVQVRSQAGLASELDVTRAQAQVATTESQIPLLERATKQAIHRLSVLLGQPPATLLQELSEHAKIPPVPPEVPVGLPSDLLRRRPDVRRAERELAAATARIGVAKAELFPRFSLTGSFGRRSDTFDDLGKGMSLFWGVGPGIRWPIFTAGRVRNNIRVQTARQEQALAQYEKTVLTSLEDVENALVAYAKEKERQAALAQAVGAYRRSVELAQTRYNSGLEDFLSVLDAQRQLLDSEDRLVQSQRALTVNLIGLYKALGGGWQLYPQVEEVQQGGDKR